MPAPTPATESRPALSVIVPAHNAPAQLERALSGVRAASVPCELIVADDASTDPRTAEVAHKAGARVVRLEQNSGPAAARNAGAKLASGTVLAFVDSDVVVHPDAFERMLRAFAEDPGAAALFGSYDADPDAAGVVTEYRNLLHHYVHHHGPREASTFWAGCGAIRRDVFEALGGFDPAFRHPSIEDIELGMRLKAQGRRILLLPEIQGKHLKRWRFAEMVRVDVMRRALPWTRLMIERPGTGKDLNLETAQRLCGVLVVLVLATLVGAVAVSSWRPNEWWFAVPLALILPVLWINRGLYRLFLRHGGIVFAFCAVMLHFLYYLYGVAAFAYGKFRYRKASSTAQGA